MTEPAILKRKLFALLIGIDCYLPNILPDGGYYPSLGGCVRDINHIADFLTKKLDLPAAQIIKLTATNAGSETPPEPEEKWPTYENMVAAFKKIIAAAQLGDQVYIHYSGHGGRSVTAFPELKGLSGLDESLVPMDIGKAGTRYLRDVETAYLLQQMAVKNLLVTVVLDSCHSGGATRGLGGAAVRGISSIDTTKRPTDSLVASHEELAETWRAIPPDQTRNANLGGGWVPEMKGTLLLAACRANELANESVFEGTERNGALTYWMLEALKQLGPGLTFKMLHDRILAKVHASFKDQTPQLHGDGARVVFDAARAPSPPSVRVLQVELSTRRLQLEAGEAQGIGTGARFAIYKADAKDFTQPAGQLGLVEVRAVQPAVSWADIIEPKNGTGITEGAQAVLLDAGSIRLRGRIRLIEQQGGLPQDLDQAVALQAVVPEIERSGWLRLAKDGEQVDYQVAVNANGEYEVWDTSGQLIRNLRPVLKIADPAAPATLAERLTHLTKYRNVKLIDNASSTSTLARKFTVELVSETNEAPGGMLVLNVGESANLRITNNYSKVLNITILDLQPDWGIKQVYPSDADSEILDPGRTLELPLTNVRLPQGYKEGLDTIKVFATVEATSFRCLELPELDKPVTRSAVLKASADPLGQLMAAFTADAPPQNLRAFDLGAAPVTTWTAAQIDFRIRRPPQALRHVRDLSASLLQAAFDEVAAEKAAQSKSRGEAGAPAPTGRAGTSDAAFNAVTDCLIDPEAAERGLKDTVKYCAGLAKGMAGELWNAFYKGDREKYDAYKAALTAKFGDCDPNFRDALIKYAEFLLKSGKVPYQPFGKLSDSVFEDKLPADATIGLVADWGTGQPEALEVLRQVKRLNPQVVIHLGDIYYAGTDTEVENYFARPWREILRPEADGVASFALPGNHDLYSGGQPYYDLIKTLGHQTSYFCLRNKDWQVIGLDTALNDRFKGPPTSLDPTEVTWLKDKIDTAGKRRTILLSHHQLFSTNERFDGKSYNENLYNQVKDLLPQVDLWLWGHEHDLVIFNDFIGLKRGRCIGGSAFPVGKFEMPEVQQNPDVPFNKEIMLSKGPAFYQHCYATIKLDGPKATVSYFEDSDDGRVLFTETIE